MEEKYATLVLEDGTSFNGISLGVAEESIGEIVLNSAVVGYQEMMTDPANVGKILVFTYPLIGNYGVNEKFNESDRVWVKGLVIKENSKIYSNFQAKGSFENFLKKEKVPALQAVDTRTLAVKIRNDGEMFGMISANGADIKTLTKKLADFKKKANKSILPEVSIRQIKKIKGKDKKLVVLDIGMQRSVLRQLSDFGFDITIVPYNTTAKDILKLKPSGVVISSGPENDPGFSDIVEQMKQLLGKIPILGISTGHQIIAQALGAKLKKLKIGHHGVNYPLISDKSLKGEITVQNHSFVVDEKTLKNKDIEIVERNLNDKTIEKMASKKLKFISIQYYPASPGMAEINPVFGEFDAMLSLR